MERLKNIGAILGLVIAILSVAGAGYKGVVAFIMHIEQGHRVEKKLDNFAEAQIKLNDAHLKFTNKVNEALIRAEERRKLEEKLRNRE